MTQHQGHQARKRFGQNFLVSPGIVRRIVEAIAPRPGDLVVEIGPGLGALTAPLLECVDRLHVVEIDRDLIARLKEVWPPERLAIHEGDALEFDFAALGERLRIVGNLPYNISTPLLFHLAGYATQVRDMHFMLQKEVVDRMAADPGSGDYGRLSVMLQYRFDIERLFVVPPGAFNPPPKVDSAIVRLIPRKLMRSGIPGDGAGNTPQEAPLGSTAKDEAMFARVVTAAFSQRRKMLRNTLREIISEDGLAALGVKPTARAEELSVADYVRLANALT
jgi:16S rRNA (adenine1518-N6/adenine1519-N6)-dimethyltransferase